MTSKGAFAGVGVVLAGVAGLCLGAMIAIGSASLAPRLPASSAPRVVEPTRPSTPAPVVSIEAPASTEISPTAF